MRHIPATRSTTGHAFFGIRTMGVAFGVLVLLGLIGPAVQAQFAFGLGGLFDDQGRAIAVDDAGNVYITGYFNGTVDFDPGGGVLELTATGGAATFLASYDALGALRYAFAISGAISGLPERGIAVDDAGNVYVTGYFNGAAIDFDPGPIQHLLNSADGHIFVASYDPSGDLRFAFNVGDSFTGIGTALALDTAANIYITGYFAGEDDFDPDGDRTPIEADGTRDGFVASYTKDGAFRFAFGFGGNSADQGLGIATDAAGNCYVTGDFQGMADFDPDMGEAMLTSEGGEDLFLASYDTNGAFRFAFSIGSIESGATDRGQAIAVDGAGNAFITGRFGATGEMADFDPGPGEEILASNGNEDLFLASYDPDGDLRFAFGLGNINPVQGTGVAVDAAGNVHLTGFFRNNMDFDPGPGEEVIGNDGFDAFVASYTNAGAYRHAADFEAIGEDFSDVTHGIALDVAGQPHLIGQFTGSVDFDPGAGVVEVSSTNGSNDIFVTNYAVTTVATEPSVPLAEAFTLGAAYPNPSAGHARLDLAVRETQPVRAEVVDVLGRRVALLYDGVLAAGARHTLEVGGASLPSGLYFVRVRGADSVVQQPVLLTR